MKRVGFRSTMIQDSTIPPAANVFPIFPLHHPHCVWALCCLPPPQRLKMVCVVLSFMSRTL